MKNRPVNHLKKYIRLLTTALIIYMLLNILFFSRYSFYALYRSRAENKRITERIERNRNDIEQLESINSDLESNEEMWEKTARERYGMQKKDETVIRFIQD